jgi:hypothetical protein
VAILNIHYYHERTSPIKPLHLEDAQVDLVLLNVKSERGLLGLFKFGAKSIGVGGSFSLLFGKEEKPKALYDNKWIIRTVTYFK